MSQPTPTPHFTEPTTNYWQEILPNPNTSSTSSPSSSSSPSSTTQNPLSTPQPPYKYAYPSLLPDSRILLLPIRPLPHNPTHAVASLLVNQASMKVVDSLAAFLAERVRGLRVGNVGVGVEPEVVVGLPTLGLAVAPGVARALGLGYSQKFWYDPALSAPITSITSPTPGLKKIHLDPHQLPLLRGKRIVIIDDAVSSGATLATVWDLLESLGANVVACGVVMKQGERWMQRLGPERVQRLVWVLESPLLEMVEDGWGVRS
ncbi:hypothetical protein NHQ30_001304 [Ciborinia camelliae]|nr:hypothetical protein NHQ30_001304 [Ciborinia camelliae]